MKGLVLLANGFEDTEALATIDVLKRSDLKITTATVNEDLLVTSAYGLKVYADMQYANIKSKDFDFLIIPGGEAIVNVWDKETSLSDLIKDFVSEKKLIAAICAGPSVVGKLGFFKDLEYTVFPGFEKGIEGKLSQEGVVVTDKFITAKAMYYSIDFALAIVEKLLGKAKRNQVFESIKGNE